MGYLSLSALRFLGGSNDTAVNLSLTNPLGARTSPSAGLDFRDDSTRGSLQLQRNLPAGTGLGYRLRGDLGDDSRMSAPRLSPMMLLLIATAGAQASPAFAANCNVSAQGLAFGGYDPFVATALDGVGTLNVICDASTAYSIALSPGAGTYMNRQLNGIGAALAYNIYTDATRSVVWGDGSAGSAVISHESISANHSVYGRIAALQNVPVGSYSDSVVVVVSF